MERCCVCNMPSWCKSNHHGYHQVLILKVNFVTITAVATDKRKVKNKIAQYGITLGGVSVLLTLILIFLYLLYVIKPIFESAHVESARQITINNAQRVLSVGIDELQEVSYQLDENGELSFYQADKSDFRDMGQELLSQPLIEQGQVVAVADGAGHRKVLLTSDGQALMFEPKFQSVFSEQGRDILPSVAFPLEETFLPLDEDEVGFSQLNFAMNDELAVFVGVTTDGRLLKTTLVAEDDFSYDPEFEAVYQNIDFVGNIDNIREILVTPDAALAFIVHLNQVEVYDVSDEYDVEHKATITPNAQITAAALLSGGSSLLIGDSQGVVSQWFEVAGDNGREFMNIRSFNASEQAITAIYPEAFRKSFFTLTERGDLGLFYTTSNAELWQGNIAGNGANPNSTPKALAISPRANGLLLANAQGFEILSIENEHPEVTWSALWQEVWYEGYPEPDYIWQSTSASDDFEAKFSLVPISFGTLKAALYAMLFAVPVAITSAIYTAYFMTPSMRKVVKPTIEIMEALPTVILGFLAGLWLAPLLEKYLPAAFLLVIFLPLGAMLTAIAWYKLPKNIKAIVPDSLAPLLMIPSLLLVSWLAFELSPVMEAHLFGGNMREFVTNDLGIDFDQRNALVVGIAMGFAVIPTIFSMTEDAIFSVPKHLTSGSLALGATPWQTLIKVVLLTASPGIFSAVMMGLGRAVGETMIVLMATGNTPVIDWSIFQGMRTLSANIAVEMPESEVGSSHYRILFLAAFVLFVFTFVFNTLAEFVRQRLRDKYSSL